MSVVCIRTLRKPKFTTFSAVQAEIDTDKAWSPLDGGAQYVTAEALKRQETGGWDAVRPALSTTVRSVPCRL